MTGQKLALMSAGNSLILMLGKHCSMVLQGFSSPLAWIFFAFDTKILSLSKSLEAILWCLGMEDTPIGLSWQSV